MYCSLNFSFSLDVILDSLDKLSLVLPEGPSDVGPDEQGVEPGVDTEHFISILSRAKPGSDPGLQHVNPLIIPLRRSLPGLTALLSDVNLLHILKSKVDQ